MTKKKNNSKQTQPKRNNQLSFFTPLKWLILGCFLGFIVCLGLQSPQTKPLNDIHTREYGVVSEVKVDFLMSYDTRSFMTTDGYLVLSRSKLSTNIKPGATVWIFSQTVDPLEKKAMQSIVFSNRPIWFVQLILWIFQLCIYISQLLIDIISSIYYFFTQ